VVKSRKKLICSIIFSIIFSNTFLPFHHSVIPPTRDFFEAVPAASVTNCDKVIPGGKSIGVTLKTDGVMVSGLAEITTEDGKKTSPAKDAGIKAGDIIKSFNDVEISDVYSLTDCISSSKGKTSSVIFMRSGKIIKSALIPQISKEDKKVKIGAWVKDAASGIGTMTFYNPENGSFAALGHGITDMDSGELISIESGEILSSTIVDVNKGEKGTPGELKGVFSEDSTPMGKITKNNEFGICGTVSPEFTLSKESVSVAGKDEIKVGGAYILSNVEGNLIEKFDIEIVRILPAYTNSSKNMIIKITDPDLIEKTGGIVQGMSGSPIIQNEKLIGAVTHVFVNDPTRGYGVFIENML